MTQGTGRSTSRLRWIEEGLDREFEGPGDPIDVDQRHVSFAPLDPAHVGAVEAAFRGEALLGPAFLFPELPDPPAEPPLDLHPVKG